MRQLLPVPVPDVDPFTAYGDILARPSSLRINMVTTPGGAATDEEGWTDRLGGPADKLLFRTLRALSDAILVGAGTIRTGRCGPHRLAGELRKRREAATGRTEPAPVVVVTGSMRLDWSLPVFAGPPVPTVLVTSAAAARERPAPAGTQVLIAGEHSVDLAQGIDALRARMGLHHLLCEGGPRLAGALLARGLVGELCLTTAPALLPDSGPRIVSGLDHRLELVLRSLYEDHGVLFQRYSLA